MSSAPAPRSDGRDYPYGYEVSVALKSVKGERLREAWVKAAQTPQTLLHLDASFVPPRGFVEALDLLPVDMFTVDPQYTRLPAMRRSAARAGWEVAEGEPGLIFFRRRPHRQT